MDGMDLPSHRVPQQWRPHHRQREGYPLSQSFDPSSAPSGYGYYPQYLQGMDLPSHPDPQQWRHHHRQREGYPLSESFDPSSAPSGYGYYPQYLQNYGAQQFYPFSRYPYPSAAHQTAMREPAPAEQPGAGLGRAEWASGQVQVQLPQHRYGLLQQRATATAGGGGAQAPVAPAFGAAASAAVAALSQLSQFAGAMSVTERVVSRFGQPQVSHSPYSGGHQPFRGPDYGHFAHHPASLGAPTINGRVHRRSRHRGHHEIYKGTKSSNNKERPSVDAQAMEATAVHHASDNALHKAPTQGGKAAWCELCRVECTSLEILEQHKNGKRHKKNIQRAEQLKNATNKIEAPSQNHHYPGAGPCPDSSQLCNNAPQGDVLATIDGICSGAIRDVPIDIVGQVDNPSESSQNLHVHNQVENEKSGKKRKIKRVGERKCQKKFEATLLPVKVHRSKAVAPIVCDLCNVMCDTREVFDRHLSGKKHIARHKRFEENRAQYGRRGLQALYPPNPAVTPLVSHPQCWLEPQVLNALPGSMQFQNHNVAVSDVTAAHGSCQASECGPTTVDENIAPMVAGAQPEDQDLGGT